MFARTLAICETATPKTSPLAAGSQLRMSQLFSVGTGICLEVWKSLCCCLQTSPKSIHTAGQEGGKIQQGSVCDAAAQCFQHQILRQSTVRMEVMD